MANELDKLRTRSIVFIVDACYSAMPDFIGLINQMKSSPPPSDQASLYKTEDT